MKKILFFVSLITYAYVSLDACERGSSSCGRGSSESRSGGRGESCVNVCIGSGENRVCSDRCGARATRVSDSCGSGEPNAMIATPQGMLIRIDPTTTVDSLNEGNATVILEDGTTLLMRYCAPVEIPGMGTAAVCIGDLAPQYKSMSGWPIGENEPVWVGAKDEEGKPSMCTRHDLMRATMGTSNLRDAALRSPLAAKVLDKIFRGSWINMANAAEYITGNCMQTGFRHMCYKGGTDIAKLDLGSPEANAAYRAHITSLGKKGY